MGSLNTPLKQLSGAVGGLVSARGMSQLEALAAADPSRVQAAMQRAGLKVGELLKEFLIASWSGGHSDVTGIKAALQGAIVNAQPDRITVKLPSGCQFSNGKGNIYAAIGAYTFGGVRGLRSARAKRKLKAVVNNGSVKKGVSVIAPRPPLFRTTPQQDEQLTIAWANALRDELRAMGIETEVA